MITPIGDKILLQPVATEEYTSGGILLPDVVKTVPDKGIVLEVGDDVKDKKIAKGVTVLFRQGVGSTLKHEDKEYIILPLKEVIGIITKE